MLKPTPLVFAAILVSLCSSNLLAADANSQAPTQSQAKADTPYHPRAAIPDFLGDAVKVDASPGSSVPVPEALDDAAVDAVLKDCVPFVTRNLKIGPDYADDMAKAGLSIVTGLSDAQKKYLSQGIYKDAFYSVRSSLQGRVMLMTSAEFRYCEVNVFGDLSATSPDSLLAALDKGGWKLIRGQYGSDFQSSEYHAAISLIFLTGRAPNGLAQLTVFVSHIPL